LRFLPILLIAALVAACVPTQPAPTPTLSRAEFQNLPTEPAPTWQEPAIPITVNNALDMAYLGRLDPPSSGVGSVFDHAFAIDGTRLAVLTQDLVIGWDLITGEVVFFNNRLDARRVFFSVDKTEVYTLDGEGTVRVINGEDGTLVTDFVAMQGFIDEATYDPINGVLAVAGAEGEIRVWDPLERDVIVGFTAGDERITELEFSSEGATLAVSNVDSIELWNWRNREPIAVLTTGTDSLANDRIALSPDMTQVAAGTEEDIRLWDVDEVLIEHIMLTGEGGSDDVMTFTPNGTYVVNSGLAEAMNIWNPTNGELVAAIPELGGQRTSAAFSPDGDLMLASVFQGGAFVYNLAEIGPDGVGQNQLPLDVSIVGVGWSPDGRTLTLFDTRGFAHIFGVSNEPVPELTPTPES
jgi:WD40 repeat protein